MGRKQKKKSIMLSMLTRRYAIKYFISINVSDINGRIPGMCKNDELFKAFKESTGEDIEDHFKKRIEAKKAKVADKIEIEGEIYFIGNLKYGFVKVGFSTNVERRIGAIQTGCPFPIVILARMRGTVKDEKDLHRKMKLHKSNGEWFRIEGLVKGYIDSLNNNF